MEIDLERHEHVTAPLALVWEEVGSLEQILAKSPQAQSYDIAAGGERATFQVHLAWGPVKWTVSGIMSLASVDPQGHLVYVIDVAQFELHYEATIELVAVGAGDTRLQYRGHMESNHKMANRLRSMFKELAEEHMYGILNRGKVRAEQRRLAQERLLS